MKAKKSSPSDSSRISIKGDTDSKSKIRTRSGQVNGETKVLMMTSLTVSWLSDKEMSRDYGWICTYIRGKLNVARDIQPTVKLHQQTTLVKFRVFFLQR